MKCPNCGKELTDEYRFCDECGTKLVSEGFAPALNITLNGRSAGNNTLKNTDFKNIKVDYLIRRFFFGFKDILIISFVVYVVSAILNIFGNPFLSTLKTIALVGVIASIVAEFVMRVMALGRNNVDAAVNRAVKLMSVRAQEKFNMDEEQLKEVEPVISIGAGKTPKIYNEKLKTIRAVNFLNNAWGKEPVEAYVMGLDNEPRYLLVQMAYYAFSDTQLLIYVGNMDISTGIIYDESVSEIFYKDINCISREDELRKFKAGVFKKDYYCLKYLELDVNGISYISSFDSRYNQDIEKSLSGMKSYIREKKY